MQRAIEGFRLDEAGDWVALLECGHRQHVRHQPPFRPRPWVLDPASRAARLGTPLDCPLCARADLPEGLEPVRSSDVWDETSLPAGLRRDHRLGPRTWGHLRVLSGQLRFVPDPTTWSIGPADLVAPATQAIPPEMVHHVTADGPVSVRIDFSRVPAPEARLLAEMGGEPACYAHLVCADCGAVIDRPGAHRDGCPAAEPDRS